jgi:hypothetical protein
MLSQAPGSTGRLPSPRGLRAVVTRQHEVVKSLCLMGLQLQSFNYHSMEGNSIATGTEEEYEPGLKATASHVLSRVTLHRFTQVS